MSLFEVHLDWLEICVNLYEPNCQKLIHIIRMPTNFISDIIVSKLDWNGARQLNRIVNDDCSGISLELDYKDMTAP